MLEHRSCITLFFPQYRTEDASEHIFILVGPSSEGFGSSSLPKSMALAKVGMPSNCEVIWAPSSRLKPGL